MKVQMVISCCLLGMVCWMGWVPSMAGAQTLTPTPSLTPVALPPVKLEVPWVKQENPNLCGLAVLEMITKFYEQKLNQTQEDWLRTTAATGSGLKGLDLVTVLRAADYEAAVFPEPFRAEDSTGSVLPFDQGPSPDPHDHVQGRA